MSAEVKARDDTSLPFPQGPPHPENPLEVAVDVLNKLPSFSASQLTSTEDLVLRILSDEKSDDSEHVKNASKLWAQCAKDSDASLEQQMATLTQIVEAVAADAIGVEGLELHMGCFKRSVAL